MGVCIALMERNIILQNVLNFVGDFYFLQYPLRTLLQFKWVLGKCSKKDGTLESAPQVPRFSMEPAFRALASNKDLALSISHNPVFHSSNHPRQNHLFDNRYSPFKTSPKIPGSCVSPRRPNWPLEYPIIIVEIGCTALKGVYMIQTQELRLWRLGKRAVYLKLWIRVSEPSDAWEGKVDEIGKCD
jgi:hypothetical protein